MTRSPVGIALFFSLALVACTADHVDLTVDLVTDYQPGRDFTLVETEISRARFDGSSDREFRLASYTVTGGEDFIRSIRVADLPDVGAGRWFIRVRLRGPAGEPVAQRIQDITVRRSFATTSLITKNCRDVVCPAPGGTPELSECQAGECVDPRCTPTTPEFCPPHECDDDDDCPTMAPHCDVGLTCGSIGYCLCDEAPTRPDAGADADTGPPCAATETTCNDGLDDDCDGATDCADPDCEGAGCDDGNPCTTDDLCTSGACTGSPLRCSDENDCTDDGCDPTTGCTFTDNTASCDDGLWCNGSDRCEGTRCSVHASPPCPTFCNESTMVCEGCRTDADCGSPSAGPWGSCGSFGDTCDETGTQSQTVTTPVCTAGTCAATNTTNSRACTRDTDGTTCRSTGYGAWGSCGYSSTCDETATRRRTVTTYRCSAASCRSTSSTGWGSCSRNTDGISCPPPIRPECPASCGSGSCIPICGGGCPC